MAAFDRIKKLLCLKKILTLHSAKFSSSPNSSLLYYTEVKQIEAVFRRCSSKQMFLK